MSGFSADWLTLREPADRRARDPALLAAVAAHFAGREQVMVTDLGCGTGATLRALAGLLPPRQIWRLVDHDAALLDAIDRRSGPALPADRRIDFRPCRADLQREIEAVLALEADLVATSAFLDLVSADWLDRFATAVAAYRRPVYAALSYDGRTACTPPDSLDRAILEAFNAHQRQDKGLGGALGPDAVAAAIAALTGQGYRVRAERADWRLEPADSALQERLVRGWHEAVAELDRFDPAELDAWLARRLERIAAGTSRLTVGHVDLWAVPG